MKASRGFSFLVGLNLIFIMVATGALADVKVFIRGDRLTVEARGIPLREILTRINDQGARMLAARLGLAHLLHLHAAADGGVEL